MKIKGFYSFTAFAGIAIFDFKHSIDDKVLFCWVEGNTYIAVPLRRNLGRK